MKKQAKKKPVSKKVSSSKAKKSNTVKKIVTSAVKRDKLFLNESGGLKFGKTKLAERLIAEAQAKGKTVTFVSAAKTGPSQRALIKNELGKPSVYGRGHVVVNKGGKVAGKPVKKTTKVIFTCVPGILPKHKNVVIVGSSATGKTHLASLIKEQHPDFRVFHSDDYKNEKEGNFKQALYDMMDDIRKDISPRKLIEGIQGVRLLRKGLEQKNFYADLVIVCHADWETRVQRYKARGEEDKLRYVPGFDKMLGKIMADYLHMLKEEPKERKPKIITVQS